MQVPIWLGLNLYFCSWDFGAALPSYPAYTIRKFPFWDKLCTCSTHCLWTAFHLTGPGAPLFLSPPISWPLCHFLSFHHHLPTPSPSAHPSANSIWTPSHSIHIFFPFLDK